MKEILGRINSSADLKKLSIYELEQLAGEIRELILETVSKKGGHLAPNLGVVELTLALHYTFSLPEDKIIFDVGHQCYTHKILTGRLNKFSRLRELDGVAGFPKRAECEFDFFDSGHSGDAVSVALGMAIGKKDGKVIVVIGDGSIASGVAFEGLNNAGALKEDLIVVLNDNEMSIAKSNGALALYLNKIITGRIYKHLKSDLWNLLGILPPDLSKKTREIARKIKEGLKNLFTPSILFEELGFRYFGPIPGHNLKELISIFQKVKKEKGPLLVHIITQKGKGYLPSQNNPELFHGVSPFDLKTGKIKTQGYSYSDVVGESLIGLAEKKREMVVITPGMCLGSGLLNFRKNFPTQFFDVGIAEQHALNFAAGLALSGKKPVVVIYSTFLLRAYDQLVNNILLQKLPIVFLIDRAGAVGGDGETHQGIYDLSYLRFLPNVILMAPANASDLKRMIVTAIDYNEGPCFIRYPKEEIPEKEFKKEDISLVAKIEIGRGEILQEGEDGCIIGIGYGTQIALNVAQILEKRFTVVDAKFVKPLDKKLFTELSEKFETIFTIEDNLIEGGFGSALIELFQELKLVRRVIRFGFPSVYLPTATRRDLFEKYNLSAEKIAKRIIQLNQK